MSKAGWRDMLTLMAMCWNQQKLDQLATSLTHRYQKATKALLTQLQNLESLKVRLAVTDSQLDEWVSDVKEWAEDTDGNKARAKIRRKIREEKGILTSAVEKYNRMVPDKETLCLEEILSGDTAWPWQRAHSEGIGFAYSKCRHCECNFDDMQSVFEEKKFVQRTLEKHIRQCFEIDKASTDLLKASLKTTYGINRRSRIVDQLFFLLMPVMLPPTMMPPWATAHVARIKNCY
ncbi:alpha-2-macroglobulin-like protein [Sarotherodon galilaeus]